VSKRYLRGKRWCTPSFRCRSSLRGRDVALRRPLRCGRIDDAQPHRGVDRPTKARCSVRHRPRPEGEANRRRGAGTPDGSRVVPPHAPPPFTRPRKTWPPPCARRQKGDPARVRDLLRRVGHARQAPATFLPSFRAAGTQRCKSAALRAPAANGGGGSLRNVRVPGTALFAFRSMDSLPPRGGERAAARHHRRCNCPAADRGGPDVGRRDRNGTVL